MSFACLLTACGKNQDTSQTLDIYWNDAETRHDATPEELEWTIKGSGCTASALTAKYVLTANHCRPSRGDMYLSGANQANGVTERDIRVVRVAESSSSYDYSILEIEWVDGFPTEGQKYSPYISTKDEDLTMGTDEEATPLFTVGYPIDRDLRATYAEGFSKAYSGTRLKYNVGSINGNSGGAVWTIETKTLVSMTNSGPHSYGQSGWNNNDPENPRAWNNGVAFAKIYSRSQLLKQIFPDGDNGEVDEYGNLEPSVKP
jgi:V8-like Glu-specific endopeptidase